MKIITILRELNWGLQSFNDVINRLGLSIKYSYNSKISVQDYEFLKKLLIELKKEERLLKEIQEVREGINTLCLRDNQDPLKMGELEKKQLFNLLRNQPLESILMPQINDYSEENFWIIYNWNVEWNKKDFFEKRKAFNSYISDLVSYDDLSDIQIDAITSFINHAESNRASKPNYTDCQKLIRWYKRWISLSEEEKEEEEHCAYQELNEQSESDNNRIRYNNSVDEETAIMAALIHGDGDKFGFD